jgi:3-deoxy-manno-octulosonate cytidylyltransferase (CMP-KDO synthetase)
LDYYDLGNVKIATTQSDRALYFSRHPVPCSRNFDLSALKLHVGIYAFTPSALESFCKLPASPLERLEGLEQLRALDAQIPILCKHVVCNADESFRGIDTPSDLEWAESFNAQKTTLQNPARDISA